MRSPVLARRRIVAAGLALAGAGLLTGCGLLPFGAQQPPGPRRIGVLDLGTDPTPFDAFSDGMRALGYVEGENLLIEYRSAQGQVERLPTLAAELVHLPVEILVARDTISAAVASQVTTTVPIVV